MPTSDTPCTPEEHTVDDVIIWALLTTSSNLALWCPFRAECSGLNRPLKATRWKNGKTTCDQPRPLYGLTNNALLVSRVYVCDRELSRMIQLFCPKYRVCFLFHSCYFTRWELRENPTVFLYLMPMLVLPSVKFKLFGYRRCMMRMPYEEQLISLSACTANSKLCTSYPEFEQKFQNPGEKVIPSCIATDCWELLEKGTFAHHERVSNDC